MRKYTGFALMILLSWAVPVLAGPYGKISGHVTDVENGQSLPGVDVTIVGTLMGASTNVDGFFTILNVPPGTYTLRFSLVGYVKTTVENVKVEIDLTSTINRQLQSTTLETDEVVVIAQRPVVTRDVSASQFNIEAVAVESMPVQTVAEVLTLQAGIEKGSDGIVVRGGGTNQTMFVVDGYRARTTAARTSRMPQWDCRQPRSCRCRPAASMPSTATSDPVS